MNTVQREIDSLYKANFGKLVASLEGHIDQAKTFLQDASNQTSFPVEKRFIQKMIDHCRSDEHS